MYTLSLLQPTVKTEALDAMGCDLLDGWGGSREENRENRRKVTFQDSFQQILFFSFPISRFPPKIVAYLDFCCFVFWKGLSQRHTDTYCYPQVTAPNHRDNGEGLPQVTERLSQYKTLSRKHLQTDWSSRCSIWPRNKIKSTELSRDWNVT